MKTKTLLLLLLLSSVRTYSQWIKLNSGTAENLNSVSFSGVNDGWAVGDHTVALVTDDGGNNWNQSNVTMINASFYGVSFPSQADGHIVGNDAQDHMTPSAGIMWYTHPIPTAGMLYSVWFVNSAHGWAVGENGSVIRTSNAGTNWLTGAGGTTQTLRSVNFYDLNNGWAAGDSGNILNSTNAGANWISQPSGITSTLRSVYFSTLDSGWACGDSGIILSTSNGGANWNLQSSGTSLNLNSICFANSQKGWAVGDSGTILSTSDGGVNWNPEVSSVVKKLNGCSFVSPTAGWVVGDAGTILKYNFASGIPGDKNDKGVSVFPNPVTDVVNVYSLRENISLVEINDMVGKKIYSSKIENRKATIPINNVSEGTYFVKIMTQSGEMIIKKVQFYH